MKNYQKVESVFKRISSLRHVRAIVGWDEAVMMPSGGGASRATAISELSVMTVEMLRDPQLQQALEGARAETQLTDWQLANLREANSEFLKASAVDPELVAMQSEQGMLCEQAWRKLRSENNWTDFAPHLERVVNLAREEAKQRSAATGLPAYEAMMDLYEPGLRVATVEKAFTELRQRLPGLIDQVLEAQNKRPTVDIDRGIPVEKQKLMMRDFMVWLGFDFNHGRLDESHHPFCGGVPQDVRMTTRYSEKEFLSGLMGVLHETGHALYEQGLPREWGTQPVGNARGMAFHESQSLFVEMQVARSREFAEFATPILKKYLAESFDPAAFWTRDNLFHHASHVERGFIRVDADEVTYPAHIILRFELEQGLIDGSIQVKDLPALWNEKMQKYLGLSTLGNDRNGCMQDVHWPSGAFGYFPSYTLGALIAAQLFNAIEREIPNARRLIAQGEIAPLMGWLKKNVWSQGSRWSSEELLRNATGESLSVEPFLKHIEKRYLS